ncbi:MAG: stage V sporulation protein AD, partial [Bacillota bacterium]|nr:stage V sporulation protein AD [Bacillota bacterium]
MKRLGKRTIILDTKPHVAGYAAVAGKKESEGPLKDCFDKIYIDTKLGEDTWEKSESRLQTESVQLAMNKACVKPEDIDCIFSGDLLNQCISSSFGLRSFDIPYIGLFGACSTMAESLVLASIMVESNAANRTVAVTSSHFCTAERQFRFPLEYGGQRTPTSQWTVTGSGAVILDHGTIGTKICSVCIGRITDLGITDVNNMGAAMAPAAAATHKS